MADFGVALGCTTVGSQDNRAPLEQWTRTEAPTYTLQLEVEEAEVL